SRWRRLPWLAANGLAVAVLAYVGAPVALVCIVAAPFPALAAWWLCRRAPSLVGPLFFCETVRFARRGRSILLRTTYALFLFMSLYFVHEQLFPADTLLQ